MLLGLRNWFKMWTKSETEAPIKEANLLRVFKISCGSWDKSPWTELMEANKLETVDNKLLLFVWTGMPTGKIPGKIPNKVERSKNFKGNQKKINKKKTLF